MNPWNLIGWGLLGAVSLWLVIVVGLLLIAWIGGWWLHLTTRNTAPAVGQSWHIGGRVYEVVWVDDHGVRLRWYASFGRFEAWDTADEWRLRLRQGRGFLTA